MKKIISVVILFLMLIIMLFLLIRVKEYSWKLKQSYNYIENISREEVITKYEEAKEIYSWFAIEFPYESLDYEEIKGHYILVDDNRFSTIKELKKYLEHKFTKEIAEYLINQQVKNKIFKEIDGKLYITEYHRWW